MRSAGPFGRLGVTPSCAVKKELVLLLRPDRHELRLLAPLGLRTSTASGRSQETAAKSKDATHMLSGGSKDDSEDALHVLGSGPAEP